MSYYDPHRMKETKKNQPGGAGLSKDAQGRYQSETDNITSNHPIGLSNGELDDLLRLLPKTAKQARRFVIHVAEMPDSPTNECNRAAAAVNLSDIARKYNPYLRQKKLRLKCRPPEVPIMNGFGEPSSQVLWGLHSTDKAA